MQNNATDASIGTGVSSHLMQVTATGETGSYAFIITKDRMQVHDNVANKVIGYVTLTK